MKLKALAVSALMAFGAMTSAAFAASCTVGNCTVNFGPDGQVLSAGPVQFDVTNITNGEGGSFTFESNFDITGVPGAQVVATVLQFQPAGNTAAINNLILTLGNGVDAALNIPLTNGAGQGINLTGNAIEFAVNLLAFSSSNILDITLSGEAVANGNLNPGFLIDINAVPVPAGVLLMGTALGGLGVMRRRKKQTA